MFITRQNRVMICVILVALGLVRHPQTYDQANEAHQEGSSDLKDAALMALYSLLNELRNFEDKIQRIELTIQIADMIWPHNPEQAKALLFQAFDEAFKVSANLKSEEQVFTAHKLNALQRRIVSLAAKHDEGVAKVLINELDERLASSEESERGEGSYQRFATGLIESNPNLASYMARRRIERFVGWNGLLFLLSLREKDKPLADLFFLDLASQVASRGARNVNELLMLYAYAFSPSLPLEVSRTGPRMVSLPGYQAGVVDRELASRFLQSVVPLMLAPDRYAADPPPFGIEGDFFLMSLILPHCRTLLPALADALEAQRDLLGARISAARRSLLERSAEQALSAPSPPDGRGDDLDSFLKKAEAAKTQDTRDRLYFQAINLAIKQGDYTQALETAQKISKELRDEVIGFVNYLVAARALKAKDNVTALAYAYRPMKPALKAYLLASIAYRLFLNEDRAQSLQLLGEAQQIARKLEADRVKASLLFGIASIYGLMNEPGAFEVLGAAIDAANKTGDFNGRIFIGSLIKVGDLSFAYEVDDDYFSFDLPFSLLGERDFHATMLLVRSITDKLVRAKATIAACQKLLKEKATGQKAQSE